ncbi:hypothetical protein [Dyadobacter sp. CY312]|uniref:hypothetical protein n=1 Tax=Dyadobacter sp. CY312 TaxID=2907303 RepID=UPI001F46B59D|nr:hypothetical protein [Dyadobacter sp. CY312]MCE7039175.1 hypothetical protein [Dyadobacter sp. CY312]
MITPELKLLVIEEATKLKEHATAEEIGELNLDRLNPHFPDTCIYGQMTGWCYNERAIELLNLCATPFSKMIVEYIPAEVEAFRVGSRVMSCFSPIECYIFRNGSKNETLIQFLKGEKDSLTPEML